MESEVELERLKGVYQRLYREYEEATLEMLALAENPASNGIEFRWMSQCVSRLSESLQALRQSMKLLHVHDMAERTNGHNSA